MKKINASAVWGPLRLGGPGPLDKTALVGGLKDNFGEMLPGYLLLPR